MKKGKYIVKPGHTIKHDGKEYKAGDEIELTEAQADKLHVESADQYKARMVLEGKDSYVDSPAPHTKILLTKISEARSVETVEVLMSLSTVKSVVTAGNKRLKELAQEAPKLTMDELKVEIRNAENMNALEALSGDVINWENPEESRQLTDAYDAREKELKG